MPVEPPAWRDRHCYKLSILIADGQIIDASFGLFSATANGGGVAFFAHVGGFVFGLVVTWLLARAGQVAP